MRGDKFCFYMITFLTVLLTSCAILPKEEEFPMAPTIRQYEENPYEKVSVRKGDVVQKEKIHCRYTSDTREDVSFYYQGEEDILKAIIKNGKEKNYKQIGKTINEMVVHVKQGDRVKKGDVLFEFTTEDIDKRIEDIEYEITKNKLLQEQKIQIMNLEIERQRNTYKDDILIQTIKKQYNKECNALRSELTILKMQKKALLEDRRTFSFEAGMDGTITFFKENLLNPKPDPIEPKLVCSLLDLTKIGFLAETERASSLPDGLEVVVESQGVEIPATVSHPENAENVVYFNVPEDSELYLRVNDPGTVEIIIEEKKDVLYLPKSAVKTMGDKTVVYYEDENGLRVPKEVVAGFTAEGRTEIISGLTFGEEIIIN